MKSKVIWHVGGYTRNYGDFVLLESMREQLIKKSKVPLSFISIDCQNTQFFNEFISRLNENADMLLIGGGGLIMNRHEDNSLSGWQWSIKNEDIKKIKVPIVVYGIGYNKFNYDMRPFKTQTNSSLAITQEKSVLFSTRNNGTKQELVNRGLNKNKIDVIPDPGMFITSCDIDIDEFNCDRMLIGINFVSDRPQYTYPGNFAQTKEEIMSNLLETCKYLVKKYNALIVNIDHIPELDNETNILFKKRLGNDNFKVLSEICPQIYPPSLVNAHFLAGIYKKMRLVIGMRGHSNIISFGVGTPFISLGSHNKNRFFMNDIDEMDYLIDIREYKSTTTVENFINKIEKILNDKEYDRKNDIKSQELKKIFDEFNNKVVEILEDDENGDT